MLLQEGPNGKDCYILPRIWHSLQVAACEHMDIRLLVTVAYHSIGGWASWYTVDGRPDCWHRTAAPTP